MENNQMRSIGQFYSIKEQLRNIIKNEFIRVENSLSFAKKWMETFHQQIKNVIY
jgi:hypothetical protein